jgi:predicted membrane chloride channel (bestrophin family)
MNLEVEEPFMMTTFALSLLLLFKINTAYARWWEARTIWGEHQGSLEGRFNYVKSHRVASMSISDYFYSGNDLNLLYMLFMWLLHCHLLNQNAI